MTSPLLSDFRSISYTERAHVRERVYVHALGHADWLAAADLVGRWPPFELCGQVDGHCAAH